MSRTSHAKGKGLLSAVVVHKDDGLPGDGFFALALELGYSFDDGAAFWQKSVEEVYTAYRD